MIGALYIKYGLGTWWVSSQRAQKGLAQVGFFFPNLFFYAEREGWDRGGLLTEPCT